MIKATLSLFFALTLAAFGVSPISRPSNSITGTGGSKVIVNLDGSITLQTASGQPIGVYGSDTRFDTGPVDMGAISAPSVSGASDFRFYWDGAALKYSKNGGAFTDWPLTAGPNFTGPITITGVTGSSALTLTGATQTTSQPVLNASQIWNNAAVTFTGALFNITDTASASGSLISDFQLSGVTKFNVGKLGSYSWTAATPNSFEVYTDAAGALAHTGSKRAALLGWGATTSGLSLASGWTIGWSSSAVGSGDASSTPDTILARDAAANTLALRNSTNAQTFNLYNTYTDASNYRRVSIQGNFGASGHPGITSEGAGTGATHDLYINAGRNLKLNAGGVTNLQMTTTANTFTQNVIFSTDSTYDFGASGANRPHNIYVGNDGVFGGRVSATSFGLSGMFLFPDPAGTGWKITDGSGATSGTVTLGWYNAYTNTSNYERFTQGWVSNVYVLGTSALGTGTARSLQFNSASGIFTFNLSTSGAKYFQFDIGSGCGIIHGYYTDGSARGQLSFGEGNGYDTNVGHTSGGVNILGYLNVNKSGTASVSAATLSGVPFAGTGTTSFPLLYINDATATASTTLNTTGTYLGVNGHGTADLMNLLKDGTTVFKVLSAQAYLNTNMTVDPSGGIEIFAAGSSGAATRNVSLGRNIALTSTGLGGGSNMLIRWTSTSSATSDNANLGANSDLGIGRNGIGVAEFNNGTVGTYRDILARGLRSNAVTFANAIASPVQGTVQAFTDSNTVVWGATIAGGGANHVLGYFNGTNWTVMAK